RACAANCMAATSCRTLPGSPAPDYDPRRPGGGVPSMHKRQFLAAAIAGAAAPAIAQGNAAKGLKGPAGLTVTGAGVRANRGPFDPVRDQMMGKQKLSFTDAHAFDFAALSALPVVRISPTLEYDNKPHALSGPLLTDVLRAAGVTGQGGQLAMR